MSALTLREAGALLGVSQTTVAGLLRRKVLADLNRTSVEALKASGWQRRTLGERVGGRPSVTVVLPDGRRARGWEQAAEWDGRCVNTLRAHAIRTAPRAWLITKAERKKAAR